MPVAVLGLGQMGSAIARRLQAAGEQLAVWNRSPAAVKEFQERGASVLSAPSEALAQTEMVITMLADDEAVSQVITGPGGVLEGVGGERQGAAASGACKQPVLVDMSTISARASAAIADRCEAARVQFLRAPVSGNPSVVAAGNLGIVVSGPRAAYDAVAPTLGKVGPNLFYVGGGEQSRIVKLALNLMLGATMQLLAEALVLGEHYDLDRAAMLEVIKGSAIGSPFVGYKADALIAEDYTSTFSVELMAKDLGLALQAGGDASVPLPLTAAMRELVRDSIKEGLGELDFSALVLHLQRQANG